jgi:HK97 family phage portal protein
MGLLQRVTEVHQRRRGELAWPVGPAAAPRFEEATGHPPSYDPEVYGDYLATSADVFAAATLRAKNISSLRLRLYVGADEDRREITSGRAFDLLGHVNPFWSRRRLERMDELSMCIWGESFWVLEPPGLDAPAGNIWWVKPTQMHPVPHERDYLAGFLYMPLTGGPAIPFRADEVVWFRYPNPRDEFQSLSPLVAARLAADAGGAMMRANRNLFTQGLLAGGMVVPVGDKVSFTPQQAAELESLLEQRWRGVDRAHRWSVLRYDAKFQGLGVSPKDAEFVQGLSLTARQVWNAYGIPAPLLNDLAHATLANTREFERLLWVHALKPDAMLRADEITEQFLPRLARRPGPPATPDHAEYDFSEVAALQFAETETWDRERQAIEVGAMTVNEWRRRHGLPAVAWGDVWWAPVNKSAVRSASSRPQGDTQPTGGQPAEEEPEEPEEAGLPEAAGFQPAGLLGALDDFRRLAGRPLATAGNGRNGHHR